MSQDPQPEFLDLPPNAWALLSLLTYDDALTGYELKQRADMTLRFYWQAPAMSQVYSELTRLSELGLVTPSGTGRGRRWSLTDRGRTALQHWLRESEPTFPVWKHPTALRLMVGHLTDDASLIAMLEKYDADLVRAHADLQEVLDFLGTEESVGSRFANPALVASWGLSHFEHERRMVSDLISHLRTRAAGVAE